MSVQPVSWRGVAGQAMRQHYAIGTWQAQSWPWHSAVEGDKSVCTKRSMSTLTLMVPSTCAQADVETTRVCLCVT